MSQNDTLSENEIAPRQILTIPHLVSSKSVSEAAEFA